MGRKGVPHSSFLVQYFNRATICSSSAEFSVPGEASTISTKTFSKCTSRDIQHTMTVAFIRYSGRVNKTPDQGKGVTTPNGVARSCRVRTAEVEKENGA